MSPFPGNALDRFSRRLLERAGIQRAQNLEPEEIYVRVLKAQGSVNLDFYYNLVGYMIDEDPKELAKADWLNNRLQARLKQEGLI